LRRDLSPILRSTSESGFNSTVVETRQRFSFSTSHFRRNQIAKGQDDFDLHYGRSDIDIVTDVRLSVIFPFVSPAARPYRIGGQRQSDDIEKDNLHFVDGGYFDNSGLVALSTWLDGALKDPAQKPPPEPTDIPVIQISPFPNPSEGDGSVPHSMNTLPISAAQKWNDSGVIMQQGDNYQFEIETRRSSGRFTDLIAWTVIALI
jgi:hypothetical protein